MGGGSPPPPTHGLRVLRRVRVRVAGEWSGELLRGELEIFAGELSQIIQTAESNPDGLEYRAGSHCRWCPHRSDCLTRQDWLRSATGALIAVNPRSVITREDIGEAYLRFVEVERACRAFRSIVVAALEEGPLPLPDGRKVAYTESEREKIGAEAAMRVLVDRLSDDDRAEILGDLTKSALDRWAKANAPKGKKAALMRDVLGELRGAGAIRTVPHRRMSIVDPEPQS